MSKVIINKEEYVKLNNYETVDAFPTQGPTIPQGCNLYRDETTDKIYYASTGEQISLMTYTYNYVEAGRVVAPSDEVLYVTIPAEWICVYHRILEVLSEYGTDMLKDCKAGCKDRNVGIIECFNMFNAAVAARKLGEDTKANVIIEFVKYKLEKMYNNSTEDDTFIWHTDDGDILVNCCDNSISEVDNG